MKLPKRLSHLKPVFETYEAALDSRMSTTRDLVEQLARLAAPHCEGPKHRLPLSFIQLARRLTFVCLQLQTFEAACFVAGKPQQLSEEANAAHERMVRRQMQLLERLALMPVQAMQPETITATVLETSFRTAMAQAASSHRMPSVPRPPAPPPPPPLRLLLPAPDDPPPKPKPAAPPALPAPVTGELMPRGVVDARFFDSSTDSPRPRAPRAPWDFDV